MRKFSISLSAAWPALCLGAALGLGAASAQGADAPIAQVAAPPALAASAAEAKLPPEPNVQHTVSEDAHVKVDELRVRGQTQSIVVQPKIAGVAPYEIVTNTTGRDLGFTDDGHSGAAGQRVWHVFGF